MTFVLDSSLALSFVLKDEATTATDKVLDSLGLGANAIVPALWRWEVANALLMVERRSRITSSQAHQHFTSLKSLPIQVDDGACDEAWGTTYLLAKKHKLTIYDASYLETAIRNGVPLGTLDAELRVAAKAEMVSVLPERIEK